MVINEATQQFILTHINDDVRTLALKGCNDPEVDVAFALTQISGRQQIKQKLPRFYENMQVMLPIRLSLEQCSSEDTAAYKAQIIKGKHLTDLTGGFGIDCWALADNFNTVDYVERNEELCKVAEHNFSILTKTHVHCHCADGIEFLGQHPQADVIYLDPARRDRSGGKVVQISDCEPNILQHLPLLLQNERDVWVKLSPMLDFHATLQKLPIQEVYIVSVKNECKELLLHLHAHAPSSACIHAVDLQANDTSTFSFTLEEEHACPLHIANELGEYLYEPNASIMKAGGYKLYADRLKLQKLDANSHLYTADHLLDHAHGKCFRVIKCYGLDKKSIKQLRTEYPKCNIATRNFPISAETLRQKLGIKEGGTQQVFGTTFKSKHILILTERISHS